MNAKNILTRMSLFLFVILLAVIIGCKDKSTNPAATTGYEDDVADVVAASLGSDSSTDGIPAQLSDAAGYAGSSQQSSQSLHKAASFADYDTTFVRSKDNGTYSYSYTYNYNYGLKTASSLGFDFSIIGQYSTPRMSSADSTAGVWTLSGILPNAGSYTCNGTYNRIGSQISKVRNKYNYNTIISFTVSSLVISKSTLKILSGSASGSISGTVSGGQSFNYTMSIVFNGDMTATVTINGKVYTVNLTTGQVE